jgi:type II secretory pathway component PulF
MPTFAYRTLATNGRGTPATIDAPDRAAAVRELMRRGQTPTSVELVSEAARKNGAASNGALAKAPVAAPGAAVGAAMGRIMSLPDMANLIRELATAIAAGLPLVQSLKTIAKQGRTPKQKVMLEWIIGQVEHGKSLADAMSSWGRPFGELTINMTRAGDVSGRMAEVLTQAADLLDKDVKLRRSILSATLYPMIIAVLVIAAIIVVVTVIVPKLLKQFSTGAMQLPWPTRVVEDVAAFFSGYWWIVIPGVVLLAYAFVRYYQTPEGRMAVDTRLLRLPLVGRLLRDVAVARFTRTLGTLTSAGIPVLMALRVTKGTLGNKAMEAVIEEVIEKVAAGKTIAEVMERGAHFPPMLVQIVNLGERSGKLDELLSQAAKSFEDRTEMSIKMFTTALPPLLVVVLAGVVGFVILAIMLALLEFQNSVSSMG